MSWKSWVKNSTFKGYCSAMSVLQLMFDLTAGKVSQRYTAFCTYVHVEWGSPDFVQFVVVLLTCGPYQSRTHMSVAQLQTKQSQGICFHPIPIAYFETVSKVGTSVRTLQQWRLLLEQMWRLLPQDFFAWKYFSCKILRYPFY